MEDDKEDDSYIWEILKQEYDAKVIDALADALENCDTCPHSEEQLGKVWSQFHRSIELFDVWKSYYDYTQCQYMNVSLEQCKGPDIICLKSDLSENFFKYAYQGVYTGRVTYGEYNTDYYI